MPRTSRKKPRLDPSLLAVDPRASLPELPGSAEPQGPFVDKAEVSEVKDVFDSFPRTQADTRLASAAALDLSHFESEFLQLQRYQESLKSPDAPTCADDGRIWPFEPVPRPKLPLELIARASSYLSDRQDILNLSSSHSHLRLTTLRQHPRLLDKMGDRILADHCHHACQNNFRLTPLASKFYQLTPFERFILNHKQHLDLSVFHKKISSALDNTSHQIVQERYMVQDTESTATAGPSFAVRLSRWISDILALSPNIVSLNLSSLPLGDVLDHIPLGLRELRELQLRGVWCANPQDSAPVSSQQKKLQIELKDHWHLQLPSLLSLDLRDTAVSETSGPKMNFAQTRLHHLSASARTFTSGSFFLFTRPLSRLSSFLITYPSRQQSIGHEFFIRILQRPLSRLEIANAHLFTEQLNYIQFSVAKNTQLVFNQCTLESAFSPSLLNELNLLCCSSLHLRQCTVSPAALKSLVAPNIFLNDLDFSETYVGNVLSQLPALFFLKRFRSHRTAVQFPRDLQFLKDSALETLDLSSDAIAPANLEAILASLALSQLKALNLDGLVVSLELLNSIVARAPNITSLSLRLTRLSGNPFTLFFGFPPSLQKLDLNRAIVELHTLNQIIWGLGGQRLESLDLSGIRGEGTFSDNQTDFLLSLHHASFFTDKLTLQHLFLARDFKERLAGANIAKEIAF